MQLFVTKFTLIQKIYVPSTVVSDVMTIAVIDTCFSLYWRPNAGTRALASRQYGIKAV